MKGLGNDTDRVSDQQYGAQDSLRRVHEKDSQSDCNLGYEVTSSGDEAESDQDKELTPMLPKRILAQSLPASCLEEETVDGEITGVNCDRTLEEAAMDGKESTRLLERNDGNVGDEEKEQLEGRDIYSASKAGRYTLNGYQRYQSSGLDVIYSESFDKQHSSGNNSEQADDDECSELVSHSSQPQHKEISAKPPLPLSPNHTSVTDFFKRSTGIKNDFFGITTLMPGSSKPSLRHRLGSTDNGMNLGEGNAPPLRARSNTLPDSPTNMRDNERQSKNRSPTRQIALTKRSLLSSLDAGWRKWMPGSSMILRSSQGTLSFEEPTSTELRIFHGGSTPNSPQRSSLFSSSSPDPSLYVPNIGSLRSPPSIEEENKTPVRTRAFSEPARSKTWYAFSNTSGQQKLENKEDLPPQQSLSSSDQEIGRGPNANNLDLEMVGLAEISRGSSFSEVTVDNPNDRSIVNHSDSDDEDDNNNEGRFSLGERVTFHLTPNRVGISENEGPEQTVVSRSRLNANTENTRMSSQQEEDPDREARRNWILINQRFQIIVFAVSFLFSLLLFAIIVCWVVLISAYVVSIDKVSYNNSSNE